MLHKIKDAFHKIRKSKNPLLQGVVAGKDLVWKSAKRDPRKSLSSQFDVFLTDEALAINKARLEHLESLGLDIAGKKVLEVGAGIGLLTGFFENKGCSVLSTDSREDNINELKRRYPHRKAMVLDLEKEFDASATGGSFDIVFCYGTLYHLSDPERALRSLSKVCKEMILLETCVRPGESEVVGQVQEEEGFYHQSSSGWGCRPMRKLITQGLEKYFGHAYIAKYQPNYVDFQLDWTRPSSHNTYRTVFVGTRKPISNPLLLDYIPDKQGRFVRK